MKPRAWSYSALSAFETCPLQFYKTKVTKEVREQESQAIKWGNKAHEAIANRLSNGSPLPDAMEQHEPLMEKLARHKSRLLVEQKVAFNRSMELVDFFARDVWVRGIFDCVIMKDDQALILDWKTGKRRPNSDQLALFALLGLYYNKALRKIDTAFYWLNERTQDVDHFSRAQTTALWDKFLPRICRLEQAYKSENFPAKPSGLCRGWCPVTSCPHYEERR